MFNGIMIGSIAGFVLGSIYGKFVLAEASAIKTHITNEVSSIRTAIASEFASLRSKI